MAEGGAPRQQRAGGAHSGAALELAAPLGPQDDAVGGLGSAGGAQVWGRCHVLLDVPLFYLAVLLLGMPLACWPCCCTTCRVGPERAELIGLAGVWVQAILVCRGHRVLPSVQGDW